MSRRGLVALGAFAGALLCGEFVAWAGGGEDAAVGTVLTVSLAAQAGLVLFALAVAAGVPGGDPIRRLGLGPGRLGPRGIAWATLGVIALSHALHRVLVALALRDQGTLAYLDRMVESAAAAPGTLVLALLGVGVAPALGEELLFRGLLQGALLRRVGAALAIPLAAAAFGAFHLDLVHGSVAFVLGLYLGLVAWRAGSVRPAIVGHALNNGFAVATAMLGVPSAPSAPGGGWIAVPLLALSGFALRAAWRASGERPSAPSAQADPPEPPEPPGSPAG